MDRVDGLVPPDVLPYTFGDNWVFDGERRRPARHPGVGGAGHGRHPLDLTPADHDLSFLEHPVAGETSLERCLNHWRAYHDWVVEDAPLAPPRRVLRLAGGATCRPTRGADALSWGDGRIGNMMFRDNQVVAVLDWEMAAVAPPEVDLGWMCYLHLFFQDLAIDLGAPGLPDMFRPADVRESYAKASGRHAGRPDLVHRLRRHPPRGDHAPGHRAVDLLRGGRARPSDIDDLIIHRATLERMLDGTYWSASPLTRLTGRRPGSSHQNEVSRARPSAGWSPGDHRLAVAEPLGAGVEVVDDDDRVAELVELAGQRRVAAVLEVLTVHVELAAPLAVVVALPAEVEAGPEVEARSRSAPPAGSAAREPSSRVTDTSPPRRRRLDGS